MSVEDTEEARPSDGSAAEGIDSLEYEIQLLTEITHGLAAQAHGEVIVDALTGMIEERRADLERSRRSQT